MSDTPAGTSAEQQAGGLRAMPRTAFVRFVLSVTIALVLTALFHLYIGRVVVSGSAWPSPWKTLGWAMLWLGFASWPIGITAGVVGLGRFGRPLAYVAYTWLGLFGLLLGACVVTEVVFFAARVAGASFGSDSALRSDLTLLLTAPAFAWGLYVAPRPRVERIRIPVEGLPEALEGLRIVQISDVHMGQLLRRGFLARVVEQVNALQPHLFALTGDLVDGSVRSLAPEVEPLRGVRAPLGRFFVTGNHEYYSGAQAWEAHLRKLGFRVLQNEHQVVEHGGAQLVVAGVPDLEAARLGSEAAPDVSVALRGAPHQAPRVLLAHQPRMVSLIGPERVDLQLSGHTHGGQIWPFVPFVRLQQPVISGLRRLSGTWVYTSRGTGFWGPPLRVGPTGEVTLLTLTRAGGSVTSGPARS